MTPLLALLSFTFTVAFADISVQLFSNLNCSGPSLLDVHSIENADPSTGSGCQSTNPFQSVVILSGDPGFSCITYSNSTCQSFIGKLDVSDDRTGSCFRTIPGQSILCFAEPVANVFVGSEIVQVDVDPKGLVQEAIAKACQSDGCDPTNTFTKSFDHFNKDCTSTISVAGTFTTSQDQDALGTALGVAIEAANMGLGSAKDLNGSSYDDNDIFTVPSFLKATQGDASNPNQAEMDVTISLSCEAADSFSCGDDIILAINAALGAIPVVGGDAVAVFTASCEALTHA